MRCGELTNRQWGKLEPLLPQGKKPGRPPAWPRRQLIGGMRWLTRTGTPRHAKRPRQRATAAGPSAGLDSAAGAGTTEPMRSDGPPPLVTVLAAFRRGSSLWA
ncbi:transposase [Streptomyces sp. RGM 3693]|uniref:transposase n=1 Tax=Streptomyces sp. RGM 3693 TaxID=3413284 RepID=UPI003D2AF915